MLRFFNTDIQNISLFSGLEKSKKQLKYRRIDKPRILLYKTGMPGIEFITKELKADFLDQSGNWVQRTIEVRIDPITLRTSRITPHRALEKERGTQILYSPPEPDLDEKNCPFCPGNRNKMTPCLKPEISGQGRLVHNRSVLFPNLYPYTEWSAVSLFGDTHHVEIGTADPLSYRDSFINCSCYLERVKKADPKAVYMSVTQNHLPGAGGSLIHPHLQVHATRVKSNSMDLLDKRARNHEKWFHSCLFSDLLDREKSLGQRVIGSTGSWEWVAAFAPFGFYEIWGISPGNASLLVPDRQRLWQDLAQGVINTQKFYRSLNRNAYNLALATHENGHDLPSLKVSLTARSSFAPWVRSDFTGFEMASGEMATFTRPERVASMARPFWDSGA